jgi:hypothetical protein
MSRGFLIAADLLHSAAVEVTTQDGIRNPKLAIFSPPSDSLSVAEDQNARHARKAANHGIPADAQHGRYFINGVINRSL